MRSRRQELNLSQLELAERLGVTFQQVQKYERGANRVSAGRLYELARALETNITFFFDGLETAAAARRGVAEEAASYEAEVDGEALDLLIAFQRIHDPAARKSILAMVRKQAKASKPQKPRKR